MIKLVKIAGVAVSRIWDRLEVIKKLGHHPKYSVVLFILLGLLLGFLISSISIRQPQVGFITISGIIVDQKTTDDIVKMINYANDNSRIKGVVIKIDSPGGVAAAIEEVYLNLVTLKRNKPVVASIGRRALSGGYYIASASHFIYSKPTSLVGGVGALVFLPKPEDLKEDVIGSGPFKESGGPARHWLGALDMVKQAFIQAVVSQRGQSLKIDAVELSEAKAYIGIEAIKLGLVDKMGTDKEAEKKAASLAGVRNYKLVDINQELKIYPSWWGWFLSETTAEADLMKLSTGLSPIYYYLYIEQR